MLYFKVNDPIRLASKIFLFHLATEEDKTSEGFTVFVLRIGLRHTKLRVMHAKWISLQQIKPSRADYENIQRPSHRLNTNL